MSRQVSISLIRSIDWVQDTVWDRAARSQVFALKGFSPWGIEMGGCVRSYERCRLEFGGFWGPEEGQ